MQKYIASALEVTIKSLNNLQKTLISKSDEFNDYSSLSPIYKGDSDDSYSKALLWALTNRKEKDIKNIALTGPYGSGKSTILKTFQKNHDGGDLKFLNISLATFKEEKYEDNGSDNSSKGKVELLKQIEISILEQIFYHEADDKVPDSRFKKIKSYSVKNLFFSSIWYLLILFSICNIIYPDLIGKILKNVSISSQANIIIHYLSVVVMFAGIIVIIYKSIRVINSLAFNKLNIQNVEIGVGDNLNKSVLNHHIDEILYFFSVRPYNVVVIEDLDRFRETEIFTKLREINLLLNSSERTRRKEIVFVYAIRDEMFVDKDRTKFFDFIIPVIPVINSSNSGEIIKKHNKKYSISENLIDEIAFFIDDMRLLNNINNEFKLYRDNLDNNLNQNKLFAMIVYKNIYPKDFVDLTYNKGVLYEIFNKKQFYIKARLKQVEEDIISKNEKINSLKNVMIKSIEELRYIYICATIGKLKDFSGFLMNGLEISMDKMLTDEYFTLLKNDKMMYNSYVQNIYNQGYFQISRNNVSSTISFRDIEIIVDKVSTYGEREKEISDINDNRISVLKVKIKECEESKIKIRNLSLSDILKEEKIKEDIRDLIGKSLDNELIYILINGKYIDEDYLHYISLFHEQSITRADYQFLLNVNSSIFTNFEVKLNKLDNLLPKISIRNFESNTVFNYDLIDYLISHEDQFVEQLDLFLNKVIDESSESSDFFRQYFAVTKHIGVFIRLITSRWSNIWNHVQLNPKFSDEESNNIYKCIIKYADVKYILKIVAESRFDEMILNDENFLSVDENTEKIQYLIRCLEIKFSYKILANSTRSFLKYVLDNNYYELERDNYVIFLKTFGNFDDSLFFEKNYKSILHSSIPNLIVRTNDDIDEYVEAVYLVLDNNKIEDEDSLLLLVNNSNLSYDNKVKIIEKVATKFTDIKSVSDVSVYRKIVTQNKIMPSWDNIVHLYEEVKNNSEGLKDLIDYIGMDNNYELLSKNKTPKDGPDLAGYSSLWKYLISNNDMHDSIYEVILKSCPWWYSDLDLSGISSEKVSILIDGVIIQPVVKSFNYLKEQFHPLNISLYEKYKDKYIDKIQEMELDNSDVNPILSSSKISVNEKLLLINGIIDKVDLVDSSLLYIGKFLLKNPSLEFSDDVYRKILLESSLDAEDRIYLFLRKSNAFEISFVLEFIDTLSGQYEEILNRNKKIKIDNNIVNESLLNFLKDQNLISSFAVVKSYFQVYHKRK